MGKRGLLMYGTFASNVTGVVVALSCTMSDAWHGTALSSSISGKRNPASPDCSHGALT